MNRYKVALQEIGRMAEDCNYECVVQLRRSRWWEFRRKAQYSAASQVLSMIGAQVKDVWTTMHMQEQLAKDQADETLQ